jgi:hypothetical protein
MGEGSRRSRLRIAEGEGRIAEFVEDDEVEAGETVGDASLTSARLSASS